MIFGLPAFPLERSLFGSWPSYGEVEGEDLTPNGSYRFEHCGVPPVVSEPADIQ